MKKRKISIIVPVFNEEKTIKKVILELLKLELFGWKKEIIVVSDGSTDNTLENIKLFKTIKVIKNQINIGKGGAVILGSKIATGDAVLIHDADYEYGIDNIKNLINKYNQGYQVVYGSRNLTKRKKGYRLYYLGDLFLTSIFNFLYKTKLTDIYTGHKLINNKLFKSLNLNSSGFEIEMEITKKIAKKNIKIAEVPIIYNPRTFEEGKKIRLIDGLKGLCCIIN